MKKASATDHQNRRKSILEAALYCFLHHGYAKTSMNDIASKVNLGRPLIYLQFQNKTDLLIALFDHLMEGRIEKAKEILKSKSEKKAKLQTIMTTLILEPWEIISEKQKSEEFFEMCSKHNQKNYEQFEKKQLNILKDFFQNETMAEVFALSVNGAMSDTPSSRVLKKRLEILVRTFTN